jgi:hypothetical protein
VRDDSQYHDHGLASALKDRSRLHACLAGKGFFLGSAAITDKKT